jgi:predicted nucleic acid-binding protein
VARRPGGLAYLDSSALVKLIIREAETDALRAALGDWPERRSSAIARVEVTRAALLHPEPVQAAARRLLTELRLYEVDPVLAEAATIGTGFLRTLDAIHLATAVRLGTELGALFTYDRRMHEEAERLALPVVVPA